MIIVITKIIRNIICYFFFITIKNNFPIQYSRYNTNNNDNNKIKNNNINNETVNDNYKNFDNK